MTETERRDAVILAAGLGTRMRLLVHDLPKPLIPLLDRPLLEWAITGLERAGMKHIIVVTGNQERLIHQWLTEFDSTVDIDTVFNPHYRLGNGVSAQYGVETASTSQVVMVMADHLASPEIYKRAMLSRLAKNDLSLVVDRELVGALDIDEATRVWAAPDGAILSIGKMISPWNCIDTGVFSVSHAFCEIVSDILVENGTCSISDAVRRMIELNMRVMSVDSGGEFWMDIDTPEDLRLAEQTVLARADLCETFGVSPDMELVEAHATPFGLSEMQREGLL